MTVNVDYDVPSASFLSEAPVHVKLHMDGAQGKTNAAPIGNFSGGILEYRLTEVGGSNSPREALAAEEKRHEQREKKMVESPSFLSAIWHRISAPAVDLTLVGQESPMDATAARPAQRMKLRRSQSRSWRSPEPSRAATDCVR